MLILGAAIMWLKRLPQIVANQLEESGEVAVRGAPTCCWCILIEVVRMQFESLCTTMNCLLSHLLGQGTTYMTQTEVFDAVTLVARQKYFPLNFGSNGIDAWTA